MHDQFRYRGYLIKKVGESFVALSEDDNEDISLISEDVGRVISSIDEMWETLDRNSIPIWLLKARSGAIDLDLPKDPKITYQIARTDPIAFTVALVIFAGVIVMLMQRLLMQAEPAIIFTVAVAGTAIVFGTKYALATTALSAFAYNLIMFKPIWIPTVPTREELVYIGINILVSVAIPMLLPSPRPWAARRREKTTSS